MAASTAEVTCIPLSALEGDNLSSRSARTPWYPGPAMLEHLEQVQVDAQDDGGALRLPVAAANVRSTVAMPAALSMPEAR